MKCEQCGKNEVVLLYKRIVNGKVTEGHLCRSCAERLGILPTRERAAMRELLAGMLEDEPFDSVFVPEDESMKESLAQKHMLDEPSINEYRDVLLPDDALFSAAERREFSRQRTLNALRVQLEAAIQSEAYERAAQLRDQIRDLEAQALPD